MLVTYGSLFSPHIGAKMGRSPGRLSEGLLLPALTRWPLLPIILTSGHPLERIRELPPGVAYMPKPWQPLNVLIAAEQASAPARHG